MLKNIGNVLNVKDVIHDAHNTFMKNELKDQEQETQMKDVITKDTIAFNWSDEDYSSGGSHQLSTDSAKVIKKQKYKHTTKTVP